MRGLSPRLHSTILPVTAVELSEPGSHSSAFAVVCPAAAELAESTICAAGSAAVTDAPLIVPTPLLIVALPENVRAALSAATAVTHGAEVGVPTLLGVGPSLPAEVATKTPASDAPRKVISTGSMRSAVLEPIE